MNSGNLRKLTCILLAIVVLSNTVLLTEQPATATSTPTLAPTATPGQALSIGDSSFNEMLSQVDIMGIAKLTLVVLGVMWAIIILSSIDSKFGKKPKK